MCNLTVTVYHMTDPIRFCSSGESSCSIIDGRSRKAMPDLLRGTTLRMAERISLYLWRSIFVPFFPLLGVLHKILSLCLAMPHRESLENANSHFCIERPTIDPIYLFCIPSTTLITELCFDSCSNWIQLKPSTENGFIADTFNRLIDLWVQPNHSGWLGDCNVQSQPRTIHGDRFGSMSHFSKQT